MTKLETLRSIEIGERVAEEEVDTLENYFLETDQWAQMTAGNIDIVYGPKGAGKSALYTLLNQREGDFFDNGVLLSSAEKVRGATVFQTIIADPPPSELSFIFLWKLYCLTLIAKSLRSYEINNQHAQALIRALEEAGLLPAAESLQVLFRAVSNYFKGWMNRDVKAVEWAVSIDPTTGLPAVSRKTEFDSGSEEQNLSAIPVEELLEVANSALETENLNLWLLFDRLDVAFADSKELERNALRALFRAYNDLRAYGNLKLKIFVRDDIWQRITSGGFTEASHITKAIHITWSEESLLNLVMLRLLNNPSFVDYYGADIEKIKSDYNAQKELFYRLAPNQIDTGRNPDTFNWLISRTTDATGNSVPRELIHLLEETKDLQIQSLERGEQEPMDDQLLDRTAFRSALPKVSKVRLEQTVFAEYPELKDRLLALEGEKCEQTTATLQEIWKTDAQEVARVTRQLCEIGFFETRGSKDDPSYWVPFLYRPALSLVQGKAGA